MSAHPANADIPTLDRRLIFKIDVRTFHLQADMGRNRPALRADARPAGAEYTGAIQRLPHRSGRHDCSGMVV
jgi:hypothetical protein